MNKAASDELASLRETMRGISATVLAQHALTTALMVMVCREVGWRDALGELAVHACDLLHAAPIDGDEDIRDPGAVPDRRSR